MLISDEYRALNRELHERNPSFGAGERKSSRWALYVLQVVHEVRASTVLDYGCGKGLLKEALGPTLGADGRGFAVHEYDPAIAGKDARPEPADVVACCDVLEHVEPEHLYAVLADLRRVTRRAMFFVVSTRPAYKTLADGRNAHLIVRPAEWWLKHLMRRWELCNFRLCDGGFFGVARVRP